MKGGCYTYICTFFACGYIYIYVMCIIYIHIHVETWSSDDFCIFQG